MTSQMSELDALVNRLRSDLLTRDHLHERQITEYQMAEAELGERRRNLEFALDNAGSSVSDLDSRCRQRKLMKFMATPTHLFLE